MPKKILAFGELLARLHCPRGKRLFETAMLELTFGGAEANVCVLLSRLGLEASFFTQLPQNDLGQAARNSLRQQGVDTSLIKFAKGRMGLYFTEDGLQLRPGRVTYDRQASSFASLQKDQVDWPGMMADFNWFHWSGITPALTQNLALVCTEALKAAAAKSMTISVDLNYRGTLWDYGDAPQSVMPPLLSFCDVVIGDLEAVRRYMGYQSDEALSMADQFEACAKELHRRLPKMRLFAASFREQGKTEAPAYWGALSTGGRCFQSRHWCIPTVVDRIGSGDAFAAGLIYSTVLGSSPEETINFATACGVLKHGICGDYALLNLEEVERFQEEGPNSRIIR